MGAMRLAVLDVGSNTVHLLVVDAHRGARPLPASSYKSDLHLAEHLSDDGNIDDAGADALVSAIKSSLTVAEGQGTEDMMAFATSALREAPNGPRLLERVRRETGVDLEVLTGRDEARLTFLAVRRWFGWSAGRLLVLDIGGGSLEIALGIDEEPELTESLPLGAGRLTRDRLPGDPPAKDDVKALRKYIRTELGRILRPFRAGGAPDHAVATSKTFRQLARITGSPPSSEGLMVARTLSAADLDVWVPRLAEMPTAQRAQLPGVSQARAPQLLAGALVAQATMDLFGLETLTICPWALREGIILRRLDWIEGS
jgi:exopolyphosphatase/guanosine-5'-triphosphate,3'-diphosphate pyrophosphatase